MRKTPVAKWAVPLAALTAFVLGAAAPGRAGEPGRGMWGGPHGRHGPPPLHSVLERHADRIGLDEATRAEIQSIAEASHPKMDALQERLGELHDEMRDLLRQDTPDEAAVMRQAELIGEAETAAHKERLRTMLQIRALLTPEQRERMVEIFHERRREWKGWKGEDLDEEEE